MGFGETNPSPTAGEVGSVGGGSGSVGGGGWVGLAGSLDSPNLNYKNLLEKYFYLSLNTNDQIGLLNFVVLHIYGYKVQLYYN